MAVYDNLNAQWKQRLASPVDEYSELHFELVRLIIQDAHDHPQELKELFDGVELQNLKLERAYQHPPGSNATAHAAYKDKIAGFVKNLVAVGKPIETITDKPEIFNVTKSGNNSNSAVALSKYIKPQKELSESLKTLKDLVQHAPDIVKLGYQSCQNDVNAIEPLVNDMLLTVTTVGAMKAGKTTVVTVLTGCDVSPSRSEPMTSIATMITHTPGRKIPVLKIPFVDQINKLSQEIKQCCAEKGLTAKDFPNIPPEHAEPIINGPVFTDFVEGENDINTTLRLLNDVFRVGALIATFKGDFPAFDFYPSITDFPEVLVEFNSDYIQEVGRLRIIDAPGPDEFSFSVLHHHVRRLLTAADAVLLVSNTTVMDNESEANLKKLISDTFTTELSHIWVFLNKCDQPLKSNHFVTDTQKQFTKLKRQLSDEQAIPINAKIPSLVMKYKKLQEETGKKKVDFQQLVKEPTHFEILKMFLGDAWQEEDYDDMSEKQIEKKLATSLERSNINTAIMKLYNHCLNQAAPNALNTARTKLIGVQNKLEASAAVAVSRMNQKIESVEHDIGVIEKEVKELNGYEKIANTKIEGILNEINAAIDKIMAGVAEVTISKEKGYLAQLFSSNVKEFNTHDEAVKYVQAQVSDTQKKLEEELNKAQVSITGSIQKFKANLLTVLKTELSKYSQYFSDDVVDFSIDFQQLQTDLEIGKRTIPIARWYTWATIGIMWDSQTLSQVDEGQLLQKLNQLCSTHLEDYKTSYQDQVKTLLEKIAKAFYDHIKTKLNQNASQLKAMKAIREKGEEEAVLKQLEEFRSALAQQRQILLQVQVL